MPVRRTTRRKAARESRRERQRREDRARQERNRRKAIAGGQPNEAGVTQGQNAEQGNTLHRHQTRRPGKLAH